MSVSPGKNIMEVTGGHGKVFAREGSALMAGLTSSGFNVDAFQPLVHQNGNSMKAGNSLADIFKGQHVTVEAKGPSSPLLDILGGVADSVSVKQFQPEAPRPQAPAAAAPKSTF